MFGMYLRNEKRWCFATLFALTLSLANIVTVKYSRVEVTSDEDVKSESHYEKPQPPRETSVPSMRIAVVMYGTLDHSSPGAPDRILPPPEVSLTQSFNSIRRHVIEPAQENGYAVDVFAHSWNVEAADLMRQVYQPNASRFEPDNGRNMFDSMEAGLILRRDFERNASVTYDWVLVMRHDIFFYNKYDITELSNGNFYVTNWCLATSTNISLEEQEQWGAQHGTERCLRLETSEHDRTRSVPDFLFVSSPQNVDLVFINLTTDFEAGVFQRGEACCGHAMAGGRIFSLYDAGLLKVGRYKVHSLDIIILRDRTETQEILSNRNRGLWFRPNQFNWTQPQLYSQCTDFARYCFNVSNHSCPFPGC